MILTTQTIIKSISELHAACKNCLTQISQQSFNNKCSLEQLSLHKDKLEHYMQQLYVHMNLKKTDLTNVNFYSVINSYFTNNRNNKKVEYYIQEGYNSESKLITDKAVLNKSFILENCLPIMQLVPMQLASNARKYMPESTTLKVELVITAHRNYIKFINLGPSCNSEEIGSIANEGVRGNNAEGVVGMGIGLSEVDNILAIHKEWLGTTFDIESEKDAVFINSKPYSKFSIEISYATTQSDEKYRYCLDELENNLPMILIHNSIDITANLLDLCTNICRINEKNNNHWKSCVYRLRTEVNKVQDTVKLCLYLHNNQSIENLLGNSCRVNLESVFNATFKNLCNYYFKNIECDIEGSLKNIDTGSAIYTFIFGFTSLILSSVKSKAVIEVNYETDQVTFICEEKFNLPDFDTEKNQNIDSNDLNLYRLAMYNSMIKAWNGEIKIEQNKVTIKF